MRMFLSRAHAGARNHTAKRRRHNFLRIADRAVRRAVRFHSMVQYSLQPAEDPGEDMTPAGEGAFLHEAMERLGIKLSEYDMDTMEESQIQAIMQREAEIIAENFDFQAAFSRQ